MDKIDRTLFIYYMQRNKDSVLKVAKALNMTPNSVYSKLRGEIPFSLADIRILKARWNLSPEVIDNIFLS